MFHEKKGLESGREEEKSIKMKQTAETNPKQQFLHSCVHNAEEKTAQNNINYGAMREWIVAMEMSGTQENTGWGLLT